jgi:hypothetical protein
MDPGQFLTSPPLSPLRDSRNGTSSVSPTPGAAGFASATASLKTHTSATKDNNVTTTVTNTTRRRKSGGGLERQTRDRRRHRQSIDGSIDLMGVGSGSHGGSGELAHLSPALATRLSPHLSSGTSPSAASSSSHPPPTSLHGVSTMSSTGSILPPKPLQTTLSLSATSTAASAYPNSSISATSPISQPSHLISPHGGMAAAAFAAAAAVASTPANNSLTSPNNTDERKRRVSDSMNKEEKSVVGSSNNKHHHNGKDNNSTSVIADGTQSVRAKRTGSTDSTAGIVTPAKEGKKNVVRQLFGDDKAAVLLGVDGGKGKSKLSHLATKQPGEFFGVSALFSERRHTSMATAATHCSLLTLQRDDFLDFRDANPGCASLILDAVGESIESCLQVMCVPIQGSE